MGFARNWREQIREQQQLVYLAPGPHAPGSLRAPAVPSNMPSLSLIHIYVGTEQHALAGAVIVGAGIADQGDRRCV
nr:hypothetical protein [Xanthomonas arboricola]